MLIVKKVVKGFYKKRLLVAIVFVSLLLCICIAVDYATNDTITNIKNSTMEINTSNMVVSNNSTIIDVNDSASIITVKKTDKIYTIHKKTTKRIQKIGRITVTGYPTCYTCWRNVKYRKAKRSYVNYCPNCKSYGVLLNNPKKVVDGEITCRKCDCDFCCYCGRDKVGSGGRHNWNILHKWG